jgi:hypothetical protein
MEVILDKVRKRDISTPNSDLLKINIKDIMLSLRVRGLCMNKEMNKLLLQTIKYDLGSGALVSLVISLFSTFINGRIYAVGICVALANFLAYGYIIERNLEKKTRQWVIILTFFIRMAFIVVTILPFRNNVLDMIYYMAGFVSHYILLIGFNIICKKGSV